MLDYWLLFSTEVLLFPPNHGHVHQGEVGANGAGERAREREREGGINTPSESGRQ